MATQGHDALTMRALAQAAELSVPTLYNLIGGKEQILLAEVTDTFLTIAASLASEPADDARHERHPAPPTLVKRQRAFLARGVEALSSAPDDYRELTALVWSGDEANTLRAHLASTYVTLTSDELRGAVEREELEAWIRPGALARVIFGHVEAEQVGWAYGEIDLAGLAARVQLGVASSVLPAARGAARDAWTDILRDAHRALPTPEEER